MMSKFDDKNLIEYRHTEPTTPEQPIVAFATAAEFRQWLMQNHANHPGIWIKIARKASGIPTVTYAEALEEALWLGWIDGQKKAFDETSFLQKFTRRGKRSVWSKINVDHVVRLEISPRLLRKYHQRHCLHITLTIQCK
jgi:uncharacterized protein YdeI (YjbR/CyaY-like superfamily)